MASELDPGTWPSARDGAFVSAGTAAVSSVMVEGPGAWTTAGAGSGAAAADPDAADDKNQIIQKHKVRNSNLYRA